MLSAEERRRLTHDLEKAPIKPVAAVSKCIAALLVLVVVAAGPWVLMTAGGPSSGGGEERAAPQVDGAVAESRRVFEKRRQAMDAARQSDSATPKNAINRSSLWAQ